jgi:hypothetical protein
MKAECKICSHVSRAAIESGLASGTAYKTLAAAFGLSMAGLSRHRRHMPEAAISPESNENLISGCDHVIEELRALQRRARRNTNRAMGSELILKTARELRSWFALRSQLARQTPKVPIEPAEPEVGDVDLERLAKVYLKRHGDKEKLN